MKHDAHVTDWLRNAFICQPEEGVLRWSNSKLVSNSGRLSWKVAGDTNKKKHSSVLLMGHSLLVHRVIWQIVYGYEPMILDHIDGNCLNNKISNLRECTPSQNNANTAMQKRNKTGAKGVSKVPSGRYVSIISCNRKQIYLGTFDSKDEAAHAYNKKAISLYGEFAVLNPVGWGK